MIVLIAQNVPDAVRGMLKRWFIEPRPNVFVGTINQRKRQKVLEYVKRNAQGISFLIICTDRNCQGFMIEQHGLPERKGVVRSGLWLIAENG